MMRRFVFLLCLCFYLLAGILVVVTAPPAFAAAPPAAGVPVGKPKLTVPGVPTPVGKPTLAVPGVPTPVVTAVPTPVVPTTSTGSTTTSPASCIYNINVPIVGVLPIDFCAAMDAAIGAFTVSMVGAVQDIGTKDVQYIWSIPPQATYANGNIHGFWLGMLGIVDACVILAVLLGILMSIMRGGGYWIHYADVMQVVPRVLLALFAAHFSLYFIQLFIDLTNAFTWAFTLGNPGGFSITQLAQGDQGIVNVFVEFFSFIMALFNLLLFVERLLGLGILMVLTASSPVWMFAWVVPGMERFARMCTTGFFIVLGTLAAQVFVISLTTRMLFSSIFAGGSPGETLFRGLVAIAMLAFCLSLPRLFGTWMSASPDLGILSTSAKAVSKVV